MLETLRAWNSLLKFFRMFLVPCRIYSENCMKIRSRVEVDQVAADMSNVSNGNSLRLQLFIHPLIYLCYEDRSQMFMFSFPCTHSEQFCQSVATCCGITVVCLLMEMSIYIYVKSDMVQEFFYQDNRLGSSVKMHTQLLFSYSIDA